MTVQDDRRTRSVERAEAYLVIVRGGAEIADCETDLPVSDVAVLKQLDGRGVDYDMAQYIWPDREAELFALELSGGDLSTERRSKIGKKIGKGGARC